MDDLRRSLGAGRGAAMMLNIVLGAGLLTLPGLAVMQVGAAAPLVWLACAVAAAPLLWIFAVLGRHHSDAGGLAVIMDRAFGARGRIPATFLFLGAVALGLPAIAITGGHYAAAMLGGNEHLHAAWLLVAAVGVNFLSAEIAGRINAAIASALVVFILAIAVLGWWAVGPDLGDLAAAPAAWPGLQPFMLAFMMVFFAFTGWEVSANLTGEFRNPARDVPRAMALSFVVAVALYLVLAFVVSGAGDVGAVAAPFAAIFRAQFGVVGAGAVAAVSVLLVFANLSAAIWAVSRMVYSAARDGLLPGRLAQLKGGVPLSSVTVTAVSLLGVIAATGAGWLDLGRLLAAAGQNFLLLYAGAATALLRLGTCSWHKILAGASLALVCALILGRAGDGLAYPVALIVAGLLVAGVQARGRPQNR